MVKILPTLLILYVAVTLAWDPSPDYVTGYIAYRSADSITDVSQPAWVRLGNVLSYTWSDLPIGMSCFRLKAYNDSGTSVYSDQVCVFLPITGCGGCGQPPCPEPANNLRTK